MRLYPKGASKLRQHDDRGVSQPSLHAGEVAPVEAGLKGQFLLGQFLLIAQPAQISGHRVTNVFHDTAEDAVDYNQRYGL